MQDAGHYIEFDVKGVKSFLLSFDRKTGPIRSAKEEQIFY